MNKKQLERQLEVLQSEFARIARERNMWKEDFYYLQSCIQSMTLWKRIKFLFTKRID